MKHTKLAPLASEILCRILRRIILLTPAGGSRSITTYKTGTSCLQNTMQNTAHNTTQNSSRILHRILHRILRRILHRLLRRILGRILTGYVIYPNKRQQKWRITKNQHLLPSKYYTEYYAESFCVRYYDFKNQHPKEVLVSELMRLGDN